MNVKLLTLALCALVAGATFAQGPEPQKPVDGPAPGQIEEAPAAPPHQRFEQGDHRDNRAKGERLRFRGPKAERWMDRREACDCCCCHACGSHEGGERMRGDSRGPRGPQFERPRDPQFERPRGPQFERPRGRGPASEVPAETPFED